MSSPLPKVRKELEDTLIGDERYHIIKQVGAGSFGHVFEARDLKFKELGTPEMCACKIEPMHLGIKPLKHEVHVYRKLAGCRGVPSVLEFLASPTDLIMVMGLMGSSLSNMSDFCGRKFSLKTICMMASESITILEGIHEKGYIHRDVKPGNVMLDRSTRSELWMIDFGMAKSFQTKEGKHRHMETGKGMNGTARYASCNTHAGLEQSRRDDLESLGYMLLYLTRGELPWQLSKVEGRTKEEENQEIGRIKSDADILATCCAGMAISPAISKHIEYCKNLGYEDVPDYMYLRGLYQGLMKHYEYEHDCQYDWIQSSLPEGTVMAAEKPSQTPKISMAPAGPPTCRNAKDFVPSEGWQHDRSSEDDANAAAPGAAATTPAVKQKVVAASGEIDDAELTETKQKDKGGGCDCVIA